MYDDIIFMYGLMTVWGTLCETVVSETDSGVVISFTDEKKQKEISGDADVVERIKDIVAKHEVIFTYDELECPDFFEGRYQEFIFSLFLQAKKFKSKEAVKKLIKDFDMNYKYFINNKYTNKVKIRVFRFSSNLYYQISKLKEKNNIY